MEPERRTSLLDLIAKAWPRLFQPQRRGKHADGWKPKSHVYGRKRDTARLPTGRKHWKRWAKRQARKDRRMRRVA